MEIQQNNHGAVTVLKPIGPLCEEDADAVKTQTIEASARNLGRVVVDVSAVPYIDSRGLEVLVEVAEALSQGGQALKLCGANEVLREVVELTDVAPLIEQFPDVNAAVRSFL
jgi:anti-sigma B factor antagonist